MATNLGYENCRIYNQFHFLKYSQNECFKKASKKGELTYSDEFTLNFNRDGNGIETTSCWGNLGVQQQYDGSTARSNLELSVDWMSVFHRSVANERVSSCRFLRLGFRHTHSESRNSHPSDSCSSRITAVITEPG